MGWGGYHIVPLNESYKKGWEDLGKKYSLRRNGKVNQVCPFDRLSASVLCLPLVSPFFETLLQRMELTMWSSDQLCEHCWGAYEKWDLRLHPRPKKSESSLQQGLQVVPMHVKLWEPTHLRTSSSGCSSQQASCSDQYSTVNGYWVLCKSWCWHTVVFILSSTGPNVA